MKIGITPRIDMPLRIGVLDKRSSLENKLEMLYVSGFHVRILIDNLGEGPFRRAFVLHAVHIPLNMEANALISSKIDRSTRSNRCT